MTTIVQPTPVARTVAAPSRPLLREALVFARRRVEHIR